MGKRKDHEVNVEVLIWPDNVDKRIVAYVERMSIDPANIEIHDEVHITIHNPEEGSNADRDQHPNGPTEASPVP